MKVWSSIARGHWPLACEYWTSANTFHGTGVRFDNGYESERLAHILEFVMQHQNSFALPLNLGRQGLLQISKPTVEESAAATALINEVFDRLSSRSQSRRSPETPPGTHLSEPTRRRSRCGSVRGKPVLSSHFSPAFAPHVGHRTDSACFFLAFMDTQCMVPHR